MPTKADIAYRDAILARIAAAQKECEGIALDMTLRDFGPAASSAVDAARASLRGAKLSADLWIATQPR